MPSTSIYVQPFNHQRRHSKDGEISKVVTDMALFYLFFSYLFKAGLLIKFNLLGQEVSCIRVSVQSMY